MPRRWRMARPRRGAFRFVALGDTGTGGADNDQVHSFMYVELTHARLAFWSVGEDGQVLDAGTLNPLPTSSAK